jgi:hypothetical protein
MSLAGLLLLLALLQPYCYRIEAFSTQFAFVSQRNSRIQLFVEQTRRNVFQECNTIACIEEEWGGGRKQQLNATAVAFKRTTQLLLAGQQFEAMNLIPDHLRALDEQIMNDREAYPAVGVTSSLISLSALVTSPYAKEGNMSELELEAYGRRWFEKMSAFSEHLVSSQKPHRLVKLLRLGMLLGCKKDKLYNSICQRLAKGDAMGRINDNEIIRTILSFSFLNREFEHEETVLLKPYLRRVRKHNVRTQLDRNTLVQILKAIQKLLKMAARFDISEEFTKELRVAYYTLAAEFFKATESQADSPTSPSEAYLLWQVSRDLSLNPEDTLRTTIMNRLESNSKFLIEKATLRELALLSDVFLLSAKFKTIPIVRRIGKVLESDPAVLSGIVDPWIVSSVLRYAVLAIPKMETDDAQKKKVGLLQSLRQPPVAVPSNELLVMPFKQKLLELLQRPDFVTKTSADHISNFLWFLHSVRLYNKNAILALANRVLEPEVTMNCSSKIACRLLGSFTAIFSFSENWDDPGNAEERRNILSRVFSVLGEHLLTVNMSVLDISTALYAYGKASFVQDMGVFDHLSSQMADRIRTNDETVKLRQVAQSLWACGKMCGKSTAMCYWCCWTDGRLLKARWAV